MSFKLLGFVHRIRLTFM